MNKPFVTHVPGFILADELILAHFKDELFPDKSKPYQVIALTDTYAPGEMRDYLEQEVGVEITILYSPVQITFESTSAEDRQRLRAFFANIRKGFDTIVYCYGGTNRSAALAEYLASTGDYTMKRLSCTPDPVIEPGWHQFYDEMRQGV